MAGGCLKVQRMNRIANRSNHEEEIMRALGLFILLMMALAAGKLSAQTASSHVVTAATI
jgi:hypothetical protein